MKQAMPDTTTDRTMEADREDHVDRLRGQWARELPDIDTEPMAIFGRAKRLSNLLAPSIEETFAGFGLDRGEFDVIATLRRSGPPYQLTPTGTCLEGDWDAAMPVLQECHAIARRHSPHVVTLVKIEDDAGETNKLARNIRSVEEKAGHVLATVPPSSEPHAAGLG